MQPTALPPRSATLPAKLVVDENTRRFAETIRKLDGMIRRDEHPYIATAAKFALTKLHEEGIKAKLGGSLAAYLHGATKAPGDVDIELESPRKLAAAYDLLTNAEKFEFDGHRMRLRRHSTLAERKTGWIGLKFRDAEEKVGLDLVNENRSAFNRHIKSPERTGSPPVGLSSDWRLIINYIDRRRRDSERSHDKQDATQVYDIIRRGRYDRKKIEDEIRSRVEHGSRTDYLKTFDLMMEEGRKETDWRLIIKCIDRRLDRQDRVTDKKNRADKKKDRATDKKDAEQVHDIMLLGQYDRRAIEHEIDSRINPEYQADYRAALELMMEEARKDLKRKNSKCIIA